MSTFVFLGFVCHHIVLLDFMRIHKKHVLFLYPVSSPIFTQPYLPQARLDADQGTIVIVSYD